MQLTYKFRLYPDAEQEEKLLWTLDECRLVYNKMLEGLNNQDKPNKSDLQNSIPELKEKYLEQEEFIQKFYSISTI